MRPIIIILFLFTICSHMANGQQLLNGGFEDILTTDSPHPFPVPEYWETVFPGLDFAVARLDDESHNGEWAMKLETGSFMGLHPCKLSTLFYTSDLLSNIYGHPLNHLPDQLSLYYKYLPEGGDTARVSVMLFNFPDSVPFFGSYLIYTDTVFYLEQDIVHETQSYSQMLLDLDYESDTAPQYVAVDIVTNKHAGQFGQLEPGQGHDGTTLWVDDIELLYGVSSIEDGASKPDISLFPIPVTKFFEIQKPADLRFDSAILYDVSGQQRMVLDPNLNQHAVGDLPGGMYLLHLSHDRGETVLKLLKQ